MTRFCLGTHRGRWLEDRQFHGKPLVTYDTGCDKAINFRGGNGFLTVAATHAALLLAQGAGRLLRSMSDKGVVAILDPRLATARYGRFPAGLAAAVLGGLRLRGVRAALKRLDAAQTP